jgi:ribose-phosphate pyrophosphokinase
MVLPADMPAAGRYVLLVDDICSTGATLAEAARLLKNAGAGSIEALVVHASFDAAATCLMRKAGITRIRSTDSLAHPSNAMSLTHLLAWALERTLS